MKLVLLGWQSVVVSLIFSLFLTQLGYSSPEINKITNLKTSTSVDGQIIDVLFLKAFDSKGIKPEISKDHIQFVFNRSTIANAKMINFKTTEKSRALKSNLDKVFAYPYNSDTSRIRLILSKTGKKSESNLRSMIRHWNVSPRHLRIELKNKPESLPVASSDEKQLLEEVIKNTDSEPSGTQKVDKVQSVEPIAVKEVPKSIEPVSIGVKNEPSKNFARTAIVLLGIIFLFLSIVFLLRRYSNKLNKLPFSKKERIIQVVATHYLGSKKNISLVKIAGEYMVVGVGGEGISLIAKLGNELNVDKYIEDRFWNGTFEKHLNTYAKDISVKKTDELEDAPLQQVVHRRVRDSIREKITQLKPLN